MAEMRSYKFTGPSNYARGVGFGIVLPEIGLCVPVNVTEPTGTYDVVAFPTGAGNTLTVRVFRRGFTRELRDGADLTGFEFILAYLPTPEIANLPAPPLPPGPVPDAPFLEGHLDIRRKPVLSWNVPDGHGFPVTGYLLYKDDLIHIIPLGNSFSDSHATPGPHTYRVSALNINGESEESNPVTLIVPPMIP